MAFLFDVERVLYQCECESQYPLCRLYFCRYCISLRCADCTQHEADVYFCPQCLQSLMAPEAKLNHMKCKNCFECPSCQCVLALRAVTAAADSAASSADKSSSSAANKKYYLSCGNCHWSTRDAGYEDQELTELQNSFTDPDQANIKQLKEAYRLISLRDASEEHVRRQTLQSSRRRTMSPFGNKEESKLPSFGLHASPLSRSKRMASVPTSNMLNDVMSVATSSIEPLDDDYFTKPIDLTQVTTLEQRNRDVAAQPTKVMQLRPIKKQLAIKRSIRCKQCDHSLCKPEYSTSNIKFKIQLLAQLQFPEVRIHPGYVLQANSDCPLVLSVSNPDQLNQCSFKLCPDNDNPRGTCSLTTPNDVVFTLEPKNEAFLDNSIETEPDKAKYLSYNHGSKIGLHCSASVPENFTGKVIVCVQLHHTPQQTAADADPKEHIFPISIDLGTVSSAT
ncbi:dynactin subunit 4-like [Watersipora subatra]|uniref:dynactin subunit 4-like n=1 Tax=Watersipora subatra TaxID=2589382 RepID=UPI00355C363E